MTKRKVFFSFDYDKDVMRTQQIRNIGALEDGRLVSPNKWEEVKKRGDSAIKEWINDNMHYCSCVVVLIGEDTHNSRWVNYEIKQAWDTMKGLLGIYVHNIKCPDAVRRGYSGFCGKGVDPFSKVTIGNIVFSKNLSGIVECHNPNPQNAYNEIQNNISQWVEDAIQLRIRYL